MRRRAVLIRAALFFMIGEVSVYNCKSFQKFSIQNLQQDQFRSDLDLFAGG